MVRFKQACLHKPAKTAILLFQYSPIEIEIDGSFSRQEIRSLTLIGILDVD